MSGSANLGINITARDGASAEIKALQSTISGLTNTLKQLSAIGASANATSAAAIKRETDALKEKIGALEKELAAKIQSSAAGIKASQQEAEYINRDIDLINKKAQAAIRGANASATAQKAAAESAARYEAEQIERVMAAREKSVRAAMAANNARIFAEREAETIAAANAAKLTRAGPQAMVLTPASGFNKTAAELAGVKQSYLSAAESAKVFEEAGVSAAEHVLLAEVAAKAASGGGGGASNLLQRESRHVIGLFDSLARGQRGQAISSIGAAARDAGLGVGALGASMAGLVAVMGASAIIHGAESMGKWATETRAAASAAGMSLPAYSSLQGALSLMGLKADEADTTLRRLAINLGSAIADPASMAAQAFHNMGISQEQLIGTGGNTESALRLLADAYRMTADGANKSANMNELFGRGFEKIIPLLQNGSQGMEEFRARAQALGITLNEDTASNLEKTGQKADELSATIRGGAIKAFIAWGDEIRAVISIIEALGVGIGVVAGQIGGLAKMLGTLSMGAISSPFMSYPEYSKRMMERVHPPGAGSGAAGGGAMDRHDDAKMSVPPLTHGGSETVMEKMRHDAAQAAEEASKGAKSAQAARIAEGNAEIAVMQKTLATATLTAQQRAQIETELANKTTSMRNSALSASDAAGKRAAKQSYEDFASAEKLKIAEADKSASQIAAVYDEWLSAAEGRYKQHASVIAQIEKEKVQAVNTARLQEIKEGATSTEQNNRLSGLNAQLNQMQRGQYNFGGSAQTAGALRTQSSQALAEAALVKQAADQEITALMQVRDTATQGSATQKQASAEIMSVLLQSKSQEIELYKKAGEAAQQAADKAMEGFKKFFDSIGSGFETFTSSVLKSLISPQQEIIKAGLTSITKNMRGTEIQQAFGQLVNNMVSSLGKSLEDAIGGTIAKALSGGAADTIGSLLSQTFSKALGSVTGSVVGAAGSAVGGAAGNAAVSAAITAAATAETTGISTAITAATAANTAAITAGSATIVAAITASAATQDALLAANAVKPSVLGFSYAGGGVVPSAAGGMVLGDSRGGQLAVLHPREMVLPAHLSKGIQGMIAGSGGQNAGGPSQTNNLNVSSTFNSPRGRGGTGMSRAEFSQAMSLHSGAMLGEARNLMRSGWRPA